MEPSTLISARDALSEASLTRLCQTMTVREIATKLDVSTSTLYRTCYQRRVDPVPSATLPNGRNQNTHFFTDPGCEVGEEASR